jgi:hypothetical protein
MKSSFQGQALSHCVSTHRTSQSKEQHIDCETRCQDGLDLAVRLGKHAGRRGIRRTWRSLLSGRAQTFQAFALACRPGQLIRQKVCAQCIQYRFHFRKLLDFGTLALSLLADRLERPVRQDSRSNSSLCHEYFLLETTSEIYSIGGQK